MNFHLPIDVSLGWHPLFFLGISSIFLNKDKLGVFLWIFLSEGHGILC